MTFTLTDTFNRTSVELKREKILSYMARSTSAFNRTSVELKRSGTTSSMRPTQTFNRTSVELKRFDSDSEACEFASLLIEPVWN